jgi:hypothetical protein
LLHFLLANQRVVAATTMDFGVEKKSEAIPTITPEESKEDIEYQRHREQDEHSLLEV